MTFAEIRELMIAQMNDCYTDAEVEQLYEDAMERLSQPRELDDFEQTVIIGAVAALLK